MLIAIFLSISCFAQQEKIVGEGYSSSASYPISPLYSYSVSEFIYHSDEINMDGIITSISFWSDNTASRTVEIYMVETEDSIMSSSAVKQESDMTLVFSGTVNIVANNWTNIPLTTPFEYQGNNLIVGMRDITGTAENNEFKFKTDKKDENRVVCRKQDNGVLTFANLKTAFSYDYLKSLPYTKFMITPQGSCVSIPGYLTFSNITAEEAEISWTAEEGSSYQIQYKTEEEAWENITNIYTSPNGTFTASGLNSNTKYNVRVRRDCGGEQSFWKTGSFRTECNT